MVVKAALKEEMMVGNATLYMVLMFNLITTEKLRWNMSLLVFKVKKH
jgi:hypothetical protein